MITIKDLVIAYQEKVIIKKDKLELKEGDFIGIYGESGTGKTSFLNFLSLQDNSFNGTIEFDSMDVSHLSKDEQDTFRKENIRYLKQIPNFISGLTCLELLNLETKNQDKINNILEKVNLKLTKKAMPYQLS